MIANMMSSGGGLLNNPLAFGLIIGGVVLVAVALILYFFVFRARINSGMNNQKAKKADKADRYEKSTNMASSIFQERQNDAERMQAEKAAKADVSDLERRINADKNMNQNNLKLEKEKAKPKKKEAEPEKEKFDTTDEYIAGQADDVKNMLVKVRETIKENAPNAKERMSWQMPTFWQGENLIHFSAQKNHLGIHPGAIENLPADIIKRLDGYKTTKGTIHFPYDKPVDYELIADITKWRVSNVEN